MIKHNSLRRGLHVGLLLLLLTFVSGCVSRPANPNFFYTLDYISRTEDPELLRAEPHQVSVHVLDTEISQAYTRPQLVQRGLGPQFVYLDNRLWGVDLSETIAGLIDRRVRAYNMFSRIQREYEREDANFQLRSNLAAIEYVNYEGTRRALLEVEYTLWDVSAQTAVVQHRALVERPIFADDVALFVTEANTALLDQLDAFLGKVNEFFETGEPQLQARQTSVAQDDSQTTTQEDGQADDQTGVMVLPALSDTENQPFYTIYNEEGENLRSAQFGSPVNLPVGIYDVVFGSGPEDERIRVDNIEVQARQQTVVEPTWAAMTVNVIEESREPVRVRYDVYEADTGDSLGGRISRAEAFVLSQTVWILRPDEYKVIINNRPFNTLRDFVTVNLEPGQYEQLTIVVGSDDTGNIVSMIGAGDVVLEEVGDSDSPLSVSSALNGSFSFTATNEGTPDEMSVVYFLDSEVDTELSYETGPLRYDLSNTIAMSFNADQDPLRVASDEFRLRNTLLYSFTDTYGIYARADVNTTLVGNQVVPDDPINFVKREDGQIIEQTEDASRVILSPPFFPPTLREGIGININAVRNQRLDLGLRGGIGATQTFNFNTFEESGTETIGGTTYQVYEALETQTDTGIEVSAFATVILPFNTSISSNAELFVPFGETGDVSLQVENVVNVVLINNVSIYYRLLVENKTTVDGEAYFEQNHGLFIRLNYLFRI